MATQVCSKCGSKLPPNANNCPACGAPVRRPNTTTQARGPQASGKRQQKQGSGLSGVTLLAIGGVMLVLVAGLVFGLGLGRSSTTANSAPQAVAPVVPQAVAPSVPQAIAPTAAQQAIPNPEVPRISVADAKARYDAGTAVFVDTRSADQYQTSHIAGAALLPINTLQERYSELPRDAEIITYCT